MAKANPVKDKIFESAIKLFNSKGYAATSVRDIASVAGANVSTISYYYDGKEGLLEFSFIEFFEPYIKVIESSSKHLLDLGAPECLKQTISKVMDFQYKNSQLARFIWREISIDSQIVREIMSTYFMKERYLFQEILEHGLKSGDFKRIAPGLAIIQLKGMMTMPFLNNIYTAEVWNVYFQDRFYYEKYKEQCVNWVEWFLCK